MNQRKGPTLLAFILALVWMGSPLVLADETVLNGTDSAATQVKKKTKKTRKKAKDTKDDAVSEAKSTENQAGDNVEKKTKRTRKKAKEMASSTESTASGAAATGSPAPASQAANTADSAKPAAGGWLSNLGKKKETESSRVSGTHRVDGKLDLNTATSEELQAAGLSSSAAQKVLETRPYTRKDELKKKGIITDEEYEKIKENLIAHTAKN
jgi:DNA uptake protein ComE-like DNA-binding protein